MRGGERVRSSARREDWRVGRRESSYDRYVRVMPEPSWLAIMWSSISEAMTRSFRCGGWREELSCEDSLDKTTGLVEGVRDDCILEGLRENSSAA